MIKKLSGHVKAMIENDPGALFRKQCGLGQFSNDVLLRSILEELTPLSKESEALECSALNLSLEQDLPVDEKEATGDSTAALLGYFKTAEFANSIKEVVQLVESKGKEIDALIDELANYDHAFKQLIIEAARADGTVVDNRKEYSKQDIKRIVAAASEAGGLQLLDNIQTAKDKIRQLLSERHALWDTCQRDTIEAATKRLETHMARLRTQAKIPLEELQTNPPTVPQAIARAGKLTSMATADGVWPITRPANASGHPSPSTSLSAQSATNLG
eukprot:Gregarina_sp_Poly_1__867@NODE_1207_length_4783_cov_48_825700_g827_i0_p3_GENE_NODE_1207_length_4783_cov_48_825700_g827_i0NODE_1207_length_4783_cov_48_825700_g827_i0_p3_ORF_typecomplete_len273_score43_63SIKE/PF05769_11/7_8e05Ead_Ea22/PF13935_6/0_0019GldM_N/PF12081_8/0_0032HNOB/PF07700_15/0_086APG17/PF04108_12/0_37APG17/PF04108_12/1_2e02Med21/PF11221_8/0_18Med21/PF11221_8/3_6e03SLBB/PF10531_9/5_7e03SLBB/PF10531_9/0_55Phage_HK97_TLTM/PF06120_11/0_69AAA_13/PF13166_6/2_9Atg14/PF10186_9/6_5_NODE_1207_l